VLLRKTILILITLLAFCQALSTQKEQAMVTIPYSALVRMDEVGIRYAYIVQEFETDDRDFIWIHETYPVIFFEKVGPGEQSKNFIMESEPSKDYKTAWFITADGKATRYVEIPEMKTIISLIPLDLGEEPLVLEVEKGLITDEIPLDIAVIDLEAAEKRKAWLEEFRKLVAERQMENFVTIQLTELRKLAIETSKKIKL
jgi:hypothetical protein